MTEYCRKCGHKMRIEGVSQNGSSLYKCTNGKCKMILSARSDGITPDSPKYLKEV